MALPVKEPKENKRTEKRDIECPDAVYDAD
jgi:hypothetical protein